MWNVLRLLLALLITFGVVACLPARQGGAEGLLESVKENHRASRELIRTCSCRVEFKSSLTDSRSTTPKQDSASAQFWYSPTAVRGKVNEHGRNVDYVWTDSAKDSLSLGPAGEKHRAGAGRSRTSKYLPRADAWLRGLLVLNIPGSIDCVPFEQLLERATRVLDARRTSRGGKELIWVRLQVEEPSKEKATWKVEIGFDPSVNYLVRKTVYTSASNYVRENEVTEFKECAPGIFFPVKVVGRSGLSGHFNNHHSTVISEVVVNQPLPENIFRLRYPPGIYFRDSIRGVGYKVDSAGNRISPEEPLSKARVIPPPSLPEAPRRLQTATDEEPRSSTRWILPVSFVILLLGLAGAVARRYRTAGKAG